MPKSRGKTPGWAAVDLKLRHGAIGPAVEIDPYPPILNATASHHSCTRSLVVPMMPTTGVTTSNAIHRKLLPDDRLSSKKSKDVAVDKNLHLMERYPTADPDLIEDVLIAVDNDVVCAARVLDEMYPCNSFSKQVGTSITDLDSSMKEKSVSDVECRLNTVLEPTQMSSGPFGDCNGFESSEMQFYEDTLASIKNSMEQLRVIPSEPDLEEDDVYLIHRKDAIQLMRSAAQHSRMASIAYLKGDHYSAQQHSSRAREDRLAANNMHSQAAKEILSIINMENDMWKLDLHGLHASEAVNALQNHLRIIETKSSSPNRVTDNQFNVGSSSSEPMSGMVKYVGPVASSRQRPTTLQVITGRGLHSKGPAALPAAVRGFLDENGYRYEETRLGVINVRLKFRRGGGLMK